MKKKLLLALNTLMDYFDQAEYGEVFTSLEQKINDIEEPTKKHNNPGHFEIPKEIEGDASAIAVFSDGGCRGNPGPGAWAMMVQENDGSVVAEQSEFDQETTNNRMEMTGALRGLEYVEENFPLKNNIFVYTDSKYLVDGMGSWVAGWKKRGWKKADKKAPENLALWQDLDAIAGRLPNVKFIWVKGHAGHPQNERCDELLNECMDENL